MSIRSGTVLLVLALAASMAPAAPVKHPDGVTAHRLDDVKWKPGPFAKSDIAVLAGDPKTGMHHSYLRLADSTFVPPHWHSTDEYATIVTGSFLLGTGETVDAAGARLYGPGAFVMIPAGVRHWGWGKGRVVLSQTRSGALDVHWVNPADDPAKASGNAARGTGAR